MHADDRIIHFSTELIHRAVPYKKEALQKLYFDLSQTKYGFDSTDFTNPSQVKFYSRRGPRTQSLALFLPDRVLLVEEWTDISLNEYLDKLKDFAPRLLAAREVPSFAVHAATVRSTFALSAQHPDGRNFLLDTVCGQAGKVTPYFRRPLAKAGLSFNFPQTAEDPGNYTVVVEPFMHSVGEMYVEVKGVFAQPAIDLENTEALTENVRSVRRFISERVFPFLNQYDLPAASSENPQ